MCGIAGIWELASHGGERLEQRVQAMASRLTHRGPDGAGTLLHRQADAVVALGHRRLSIVDLSPAGSQPMTSACGQWTLTYNGEVYNHRELRRELESQGAAFRGHSDTEVLLAGIAAWGLQETLQRANGMWALAAHDQRRNELTLARDRLGIKPLYYAFTPGRLRFASELAPLAIDMRSEAECPSLSHWAIAEFLRYGYIPAPHTIYQGVAKLPPGAVLTATVDDLETSHAAPSSYWNWDQVVRGARAPQNWSDDECLERFATTLQDAVKLRMAADVPLGAFLSGGVDSSLVVATMAKLADQPPQTFCVGFEESAYDESPAAQAMARHLGLQSTHHTLKVSSKEAQAVIPRLPRVYDEPFADSSQIPTLLVSEFARQHITVSLSGDGGDELFGGYTRYQQFWQRWRRLARLPSWGRRLGARALRGVGACFPPGLGNKLQRRALGLDVHSPAELYAVHNAHWKAAERMVASGHDESLGPRWDEPPRGLSPIETWMATDTRCYLPDDILVKVDRASMSVGLEARVPLLDHRLVELAWQMPMRVKHHPTQGAKWLLRKLLGRAAPAALYERPKMGFGIPIGQWLRGPLRDWADDMLAPDRLRSQQLLTPEPISQIWERHRSGSQNWEYMLWDVLMLQAWLDQQPLHASRI